MTMISQDRAQQIKRKTTEWLSQIQSWLDEAIEREAYDLINDLSEAQSVLEHLNDYDRESDRVQR